MADLKAHLAQIELNLRQAEANIYAMQGAKQMLLQLINEEEKGGNEECSKSAITER